MKLAKNRLLELVAFVEPGRPTRRRAGAAPRRLPLDELSARGATRASIPEHARVDFALCLDEFQLFAASETLPSILSEARKYRLALTLSHQYAAQLPEATRAAVLGNVGTTIGFRLGADDVAAMRGHFEPYAASTLRDLGRGEAVARVLRHGLTSDPVMLYTMPPSQERHGRAENIRAQSAMRYCRPREAVEERLRRWRGHTR